MAATSGRDLSEWTTQWLQTSGVNLLRPLVEVGAIKSQPTIVGVVGFGPSYSRSSVRTALAGPAVAVPGAIVQMAAATVLGAVCSVTILRGSDLTRLMVTLGVALLLQELANKLDWLTGGADGLQGVAAATCGAGDGNTTRPDLVLMDLHMPVLLRMGPTQRADSRWQYFEARLREHPEHHADHQPLRPVLRPLTHHAPPFALSVPSVLSLSSLLLRTQRGGRIHPRGAPRGDVARHRRHGEQRGDDRRERERIGGGDAEEQRLDPAR